MREPLAETSTETKWMDGIDGEWRKNQKGEMAYEDGVTSPRPQPYQTNTTFRHGGATLDAPHTRSTTGPGEEKSTQGAGIAKGSRE